MSPPYQSTHTFAAIPIETSVCWRLYVRLLTCSFVRSFANVAVAAIVIVVDAAASPAS